MNKGDILYSVEGFDVVKYEYIAETPYQHILLVNDKTAEVVSESFIEYLEANNFNYEAAYKALFMKMLSYMDLVRQRGGITLEHAQAISWWRGLMFPVQQGLFDGTPSFDEILKIYKMMNETIDPYYLWFSYKDTVADFSVMTTGEIEIVLVNKECGAMVFINKAQAEKLRNFLNTFLNEQR